MLAIVMYNQLVYPSSDSDRTITQCCLCNYIRKWLDFQVFSDKDYEPEVPSHSNCGTLKNPYYSERVGLGVPDDVVWSFALAKCRRLGVLFLKSLWCVRPPTQKKKNNNKTAMSHRNFAEC